jgi:hypothetical protein
MDGIGLGVTGSNVQWVIGKLGRGAVVGRLGEMPPRLGLDAAENIGRSATPIFGIPRATRPGCTATGGRTSSYNTTGFSSIHTTGSRAESGFSYTANTSSMRATYSSSSSATHHIFFPPRFQVVVFEQNSDRLSSHPWHQLALYRFLR